MGPRRERERKRYQLAYDQEARRRKYERNRDQLLARYHLRMHGITREDRELLLAAQGGRCYLCGDELALGDAYLEHDHRCCPAQRSCGRCRRGMACKRCNYLIGLAQDDFELLRRIASKLEGAVLDVSERIVRDLLGP